MADRSSAAVRIATRGSALALAQATWVRDQLAAIFPGRRFELNILKTTGDRLPTASLAHPGSALPRGLFTKELEVALLAGDADLAVHSLKDLPTELPEGLTLAATPHREDVREVLLYRGERLRTVADPTVADWQPGRRSPWFGGAWKGLADLPSGAVVATSSTRRAAALRSLRPDLGVTELRGNVGTRLQKLRDQLEWDATLLAAAGLVRLHFDISPRGELRVDPRLPAAVRAQVAPPPDGIQATLLDPETFLPAVGQGALGLEVRKDDEETLALCRALNHANTLAAVTAERALLSGLGGGCQTPVAAHARVLGHQLHLTAAWYRDDGVRRAEARRPVREAEALGRAVADQLLAA